MDNRSSTTSYGPETITLKASDEGIYYYYIYRYSGSGTVASSEAQVKLYQGDTLVAKFNVPTDGGTGRYWNLFAIVNGELVINNTISDSKDTSYGTDIMAMSLDDEEDLVDQLEKEPKNTENQDELLDDNIEINVTEDIIEEETYEENDIDEENDVEESVENECDTEETLSEDIAPVKNKAEESSSEEGTVEETEENSKEETDTDEEKENDISTEDAIDESVE